MFIKLISIKFLVLVFILNIYSFQMDTDSSLANASFIGEDSSDQTGYSISNIGDVNGDGRQDFAIAGYSDEEDGGSNTGQTYILFGSNSPNRWVIDSDLNDSNASFIGEDSGDYSGISVDGVGDINDDGIDDFAIGAYFDEEGGGGAGQTYVIFGSSAPNRWSMNTNLSTSNASFIGEVANDRSGFKVSGIGDVNADGISDMAIGAYLNAEGSGSGTGQTYVIFGSSAPNRFSMDIDLSASNASFYGENGNDFSGRAFDGIGDVNNDGIDDFAIGSRGNDYGGSNAGQTYIIFGSNSPNRWAMDINLSSSNASFYGESGNDFSGDAMAGLGDVNADGIADFAIGSFQNAQGGTDAGQTYVIFGSSAPNRFSMNINLSSSNASFVGESSEDYSGWALNSIGDINDDNINDFAIGAWGNDEGGSSAGQTYIIYGSNAPNRFSMDIDLSASNASFIGENADDFLGRSMSTVGDINGDGISDFIIGANGNDDAGSSAGKTYLYFGKERLILVESPSITSLYPFSNLLLLLLLVFISFLFL